ncbi:MAG TPA: hypothetical protein VNI55_01920 [Gaiellaceae bacterium]|nr:hypothetical protein [Gaiellaceae bacterium]
MRRLPWQPRVDEPAAGHPAPRRVANLSEIDAAWQEAREELAQLEPMIERLTDDVREADSLDADVRVGMIEPEAARSAQDDARAQLTAAVEARDRLTGIVEALRLRALDAVDAEQAEHEESADELVRLAVAKAARTAAAHDAAARIVNEARAAHRQVVEDGRWRRSPYDPHTSSAELAAKNGQRAAVEWAARNPVADGRLHPRERAAVEARRAQLAAEGQEALLRALDGSRATAAALGVTLDSHSF